MVCVNEIILSTEAASGSLEPTASPFSRRFGKKLYFVLGLIAVVAVASAFAVPYFLPKVEAASVPLGINYSEGERMTYDCTITVTALGQTASQTGTISTEVLDFDGENYTMRVTAQFQSQEFSYTVKMNKTGHISEFTGLPPEFQQMYTSLTGIPGFGTYFGKEEVKVGESFQIPLYTYTENFVFVGVVNNRVSDVKNITVLAGTYNVFKMDTIAFLFGNYTESGLTVDVAGAMNAYVYLENGTCCPIEYNANIQVSARTMGQSISMSMAIQMRLKQHIKP